jgi:hypothetical protein
MNNEHSHRLIEIKNNNCIAVGTDLDRKAVGMQKVDLN